MVFKYLLCFSKHIDFACCNLTRFFKIDFSFRHVMDGSLPNSLKHIISNAEYYGPSLFLLATDVVTNYVFQEPSLLSSLQDNGLTDVVSHIDHDTFIFFFKDFIRPDFMIFFIFQVLHALLVKDVPATREVLGSLPNVFSALCLNNRGLNAFVECRPFERLFKVLLSPDYLPAMRRRRRYVLSEKSLNIFNNRYG